MSDGTTIARPYAEALFQISLDEGEKFNDELNFLATVLRDKDLSSYLSNPTVSKDKGKKFVLSILPENFNQSLKNFFGLLIDNSRIIFFEEILQQFHNLENEHNKVLEAKILSAFELLENQKDSIKEKSRIADWNTLDATVVKDSLERVNHWLDLAWNDWRKSR